MHTQIDRGDRGRAQVETLGCPAIELSGKVHAPEERHPAPSEVAATHVNSTGNAGLDALADAIAARVAARLNKSEEPRLMSVNEAAVYIGHTPRALRHMIADGRIPAIRDGSRVHLDRADLDQWIEMRRVKR
jgi:excisionase family DNA binding protein